MLPKVNECYRDLAPTTAVRVTFRSEMQLRYRLGVRRVPFAAQNLPRAAEAAVFVPVATWSLPCMRAFLLATSEDQRARLMLPTGVLSAVEFPVTSKYTASAALG
jgi:hypothetical protein